MRRWSECRRSKPGSQRIKTAMRNIGQHTQKDFEELAANLTPGPLLA